MRVHSFDYLVELPSELVRLDCAALHLARDTYADIEVPAYLAKLDMMAEEVAALRPGLDATLRYAAMRQVLVDGYDLRGDEADYYHPQNGYLNRVIDRSRGMPITVSLVWLEVARRLKWPVHGLAMPGHFLIRFDDPDRTVICDTFRAGRTVNQSDCQKILDHCFDGKVKLKPCFLEPVDTRVILARMLNNLRSIYLVNQSWPHLENILQRLCALEPEQGRHLQELAALHYRQGDVRLAYAHLAHYVRTKPQAEDLLLVRQRLDHLEAACAALN
jgi:regulator of sirC expression with transglutaminase-like and TPR domain